MIELVYYGMMPVLIFAIAVLYHLDIDLFEFRHDPNIFGIVFIIAIWPLVLVVAIIFLVVYAIVAPILWLAKKTADSIKKGTAK